MSISIKCGDCGVRFALEPDKNIAQIVDDHNKEYHPEKVAENQQTTREPKKGKLSKKRQAYRDKNKIKLAKYGRDRYHEKKGKGGGGGA